MNPYLPEKGYKRLLVLAVYIAAGAAILILAVRYLLGAVLPFLLAWATAALLRPMAAAIRKKTRMTERAAGFAALFLLLLLIGVGVGWLIFTVISQAGDLLRVLTENADSLGKELGGLSDRILTLLPIPDGADRDAWQGAIRSAISQTLSGILNRLTAALPAWVGGMLSRIPGAMLFLTVYVVSAFTLCMRTEPIGGAIYAKIPPLAQRFVAVIRAQLARLGFSYLRAALILLALTFAELYIGFVILNVPYALLLAALVALVDLLPILGAGTVLIPWAVFCLLTHRFRLGVGLLILFLILTVIRQVLEPRVVGKSFGLSPLATLTAMYAGWYLFGVLGMILLPALVTLTVKFLGPMQASGSGEARDPAKPHRANGP